MKAARIENSQRLQRVSRLLSDGREYTTLDIVIGASVCAVNSCIAELRANGYDIRCRRHGDLWFYRMETANELA
jgi:biotin operon repressor